MKHTDYIITGPTASGKSDFAHNLAQTVGGAIINCDSVQIYRGIENISASPLAGLHEFNGQIDGVPYAMFSIVDLDSQLSVVEYLNMARAEYERLHAAGYPVIFVGGTGYYINAIVNGISPMPDIADDVRTRARDMVRSDINAARRMLGNDFPHTDPQRISRALEVLMQTGRQISEFQSLPRTGGFLPSAVRILINPPADVLSARIAARIPHMLDGGATTEAQRIIARNQNPNRAIGAAQLCAYLRGEKSKDECISEWITKTRQYAKRQRTWFRTQFDADIIINRVPTDADMDTVLSH